MKFRILIILVSLAFSAKAQHAYFSSPNQNLLSVNPAFAGTNKQLRVQAITGKTDWGKYGSDNRNYYAGTDFLAKKHHGLGLSFSSEVYGKAQRSVKADFSYAFHFIIKDKVKIVSALQVSYFEIRLDRSAIPFDYFNDVWSSRTSQWGPENVGIATKRNMDFSGGLLVYGKRFYAGVSILSITQPDEGLLGVSKRPLTQIYQGKYKFLDPERFNLDLYGFVKLQEIVRLHKDQIYHQTLNENFVQYGTYLNYKLISFHVAHRLNAVSNYDAFVMGAAINLGGLKIGYNNRCNYGTHLSNVYFNEFYLQYAFGRTNKGDEETSDVVIKLID